MEAAVGSWGAGLAEKWPAVESHQRGIESTPFDTAFIVFPIDGMGRTRNTVVNQSQVISLNCHSQPAVGPKQSGEDDAALLRYV